MCPHTTAETLGAGVEESVAQVALYTAIHVSYDYVSSYYYMCPHITAESSEADVEEAVAHIYVLILVYVCPHTTTYMSSYYYMCVLILQMR